MAASRLLADVPHQRTLWLLADDFAPPLVPRILLSPGPVHDSIGLFTTLMTCSRH